MQLPPRRASPAFRDPLVDFVHHFIRNIFRGRALSHERIELDGLR